MGSMSGTAPANMPALPEWLRILWVAALLAAVTLHLRHARLVGGPGRLWHVGHTTMAAGMTLMYLVDRMRHPALYQVELALFTLLTTAVVTAVVTRRERLLNPMWVGVTLDLLSMVYMLLPAQNRNPALTGVVLTYLSFQVMTSTLGRWRRTPRHEPAMNSAQDLDAEMTMTTEVTTPLRTPHVTVVERVGRCAPQLYPHHRRQVRTYSAPSVRASLAVVAASMGYMLALM